MTSIADPSPEVPGGEPLAHGQAQDVALDQADGCTNQYCFAPDSNCHLGELEIASCINWQQDIPIQSAPMVEGERPPWSGLALGTVDAGGVAATRRARVVALVGGTGAGKTSLLTAIFTRLRRGGPIGGLRFAGSYTLLGWDQVTYLAAFPPEGTRGFPPHTTSGREPALLHVRLASGSRAFWDIYFTDAPGEWFEEWAYEPVEMPGAQWMSERADMFVLLSDSAALSGESRGAARNAYRVLASRVSSVANGREVYPVRAKYDLMSTVAAEIDEALNKTDIDLFGQTAAPLSVIAESPVPDALHVLDEVVQRVTAPAQLSVADPKLSSDPFLSYRSPLAKT